MPALIVVGHGSHLSAESSAPVREHAERIREMGIFDEVLEAFWKEEPNLRDAVDLVESTEVFIVPLFLAEGYFTRLVVPRELGVDIGTSVRGGKLIHLCPPVGTHSVMRELVVRQATRITKGEVAASDTTLIVIGHGTDRSATSGDTVYDLVEAIRATGRFAAVDCGFLDEEPRITGVLEKATTPDVVLVPFFVAEGWHTATTIPEDLGLQGSVTRRGSRRIWYTPPVGIMPEMAEAIVDVAASTAPLHANVPHAAPAPSPEPPAGHASRAGSHSPHPEPRSDDPTRTASDASITPVRDARNEFIAWLTAAGSQPRTLLQIAIRHTGDDTYRIGHVRDAEVATTELASIPDRRTLLETVRYNSAGEYRPLRTRNDLPSGWVVDGLRPEQVCEAVEAIYPGCILHWHQHTTGSLEVVSFERWAARQTGIYRDLRNLTPAAVQDVIRQCCASCLRTRSWPVGEGRSAGEPGDNADSSTDRADLPVPCREPCSILATAAREIRSVSACDPKTPSVS